MPTDANGVWAYAVVGAPSAADRVPGLRGVGEEPVRVMIAGDLGAARLERIRASG